MVLDSNLFTLSFRRRQKDPTVLDVFPFASSSSWNKTAGESSSNAIDVQVGTSSSIEATPLYSFSRAKAGLYSVQLIDSLTGIVLASIECPSSGDKVKTIKLYNPDEQILLEKKANTFKQEWRWTWEDEPFLIRRDGRSIIIEAIRKPDPEIDIAHYTPASKTRAATLQFLDYNIARLDVHDKRGLEILGLLTCLHCLDQEYDEQHKEGQSIYSTGSPYQAALASSASIALHDDEATGSSGARQERLEPNELVVDLHVADNVYVEHALSLLRQDDGGEGLHLIILRSDAPGTTARAVRIAAEVKARWYKLPPIAKGRTMDPMPGNASEIAEELYQYVRDPILVKQKQQHRLRQHEQQQGQTPARDPTVGPRGRIKLDSPSSNSGLNASSTDYANTSSTPSPAVSSAKVTKKKERPFSTQAPPSQLHIYLSKDRIDEFERDARAPSSSSSSLPLAPADDNVSMSKRQTHSAFAPTNASSASSPQLAPLPPPSIPPKTQRIEGSESSAKRFLGRLVRRQD